MLSDWFLALNGLKNGFGGLKIHNLDFLTITVMTEIWVER
jgi:hypothetical protein